MKLKYIIPALMAAVTMLMSCNDIDDAALNSVSVSSSYVTLPLTGGSTTMTVKASGDWAFVDVPHTVKKETVYYTFPTWLKASVTSGSAGETVVTFSAEGAIDGRSDELWIKCGNEVQRVNVMQGVKTVANATCADVIAGPDSKSYRVSGTVGAIANTTYGNWYLKDATGEIYIYGTLDAKGNTKNFASLGLETGDIVTVEGPKTTYGSVVELVDVTVVNIEKSLIKVDSLEVAGTDELALPVGGGEIKAFLTCKGTGVGVEIPEAAKSWLGVSAATAGSQPTVTLRAAANTGGDRSTKVVFTTTDGKKTYTSEATISQKGAIVEVSMADFLAAPVGDTQFRVTGVITKVAKAEYGNIYIRDHSGEIYVYGVGKKGDFAALGLKEGDVITLVGKRGEYKGSPQMTGGTYESSMVVPEISIADFRNLADDKNKYYRISGVVAEATEEGTKNDVEKYGNFNLTDETGSVYIYGVLKGWNGAKGQFGELGIGFGDKLTILAYKTSYKGLVEGVGVYYSHEKVAE